MVYGGKQSGGPSSGGKCEPPWGSGSVGFSPAPGLSVGAAFRWAWAIFRSDLEGVGLPIVLGGLWPLLVASIVHGVGSFLLGTAVTRAGQHAPWGLTAVVVVVVGHA